MSTISNVSLSGIRFASDLFSAAASNAANLMTDGYKARRVSAITAPGGGVSTVVRRSTEPGMPVYDANGIETSEPREMSNVNLEDVMMGTHSAAFMYSANASVIRAEDDAVGTLIDIVA